MAKLISEQIVCEHLGIDREALRRWVELGLVRAADVGGESSFDAGDIRRIWSIFSMLEDLDVNLEGAQIILQMSEEISQLKRALVEAKRSLDRVRELEAFHWKLLQERLGAFEADVDM